jgi:hypothetical protein
VLETYFNNPRVAGCCFSWYSRIVHLHVYWQYGWSCAAGAEGGWRWWSSQAAATAEGV